MLLVAAFVASFGMRQLQHHSMAHFVIAACAEDPLEGYSVLEFFSTGRTSGL
jgi:hypothetical protein